MHKLLLLLTLTPCIAFGQTTLIPDSVFEQVLIDLGYDTGTPDGSVPTANISAVTALDVSVKYINDLTGIEDFTTLTYLDCEGNALTSLDVSLNTSLTILGCGGNALTSLDVSLNTSLTILVCDDNQLTSLDVSNNAALNRLHGDNNQLTSLDVSNNTALIWLECSDNQLTCLNVRNGNNNSLTTFSASSNPNLTCIEVDDNAWSMANWGGIDSLAFFSEDCNNPCSSTTGIQELAAPDKHLIYITDILGRTTQPVPNTLMFYIYDDGSVEKRIQLER